MPLSAPNIKRLQAKRNVQRLIKALGYEPDHSVRAAACRALGELGDLSAVEPLIAVLDDRKLAVSQAAVEALGRLGDRRAVAPLIAVLEDGHPDSARAAAAALGELGDERAIAPLVAELAFK